MKILVFISSERRRNTGSIGEPLFSENSKKHRAGAFFETYLRERQRYKRILRPKTLCVQAK